MQTFEIPLSANPQKFTVRLKNVDYVIRLYYANAVDAGWAIDIANTNNEPICNGIPLVTGANLLEQYQHHGFDGALWVQTKGNPDAVPTWDNIGTESLLFWVTE